MVFLEDIPLNDWLIPVSNSRNAKLPKWVDIAAKSSKRIKKLNSAEIEGETILNKPEECKERIISIDGYKTTFTIKNNIARLNLRRNGRVFKNFEISELEEIIKMIDSKSLSRIKDKNASARKFLYYLKVWEETETNAVRVKNIELRGKDYHLDHIIPITYCFYNNICHTKAGGLLNLQIISHIDNMSKNVKVNLSELYRVH